MPRIHFVQELPVGSTKKDKELERARARAHAASVSYQSHHVPRPQPPPKPERLRRVRTKSVVTADGGKPSWFNKSASSFSPLEGGSTFDSAISPAARRSLDTPPESPERVESSPVSASQSSSLVAVADCPPDEELTPPDSNWTESVADDGDGTAEHIEDISDSSSSLSALIAQKRHSHNVYQINPHAQYTSTSTNMPWSTSTTNMTDVSLDFIPHDLLGTRADPFDCIPHRHAHSASVDAVTDYHAQIMAPNHAPIYKIFNVTNVYTSYYFELLTNPDFLYTGVASVQAIIDHLRRRPDEPVGPSEQVMKHIGTAMGRLRKRLGRLQKEARESEQAKVQQRRNPGEEAPTTSQGDIDMDAPANPTLIVDDMTIMTVLFLAVVTRAINDLSSHEIHKRTISSLVSARGGLQNLTGHDGLARCTLMQWESFWALNTGTTIFPDARPPYQPIYPSTPIAGDTELGRKIAGLPVGFQALARQRRLALDVVEVLSRTAEAHVEQAAHGTIVTPSDVFRTKPRKFQDFWEACTCLGAPEETYTSTDVGGAVVTIMMPNLEKLIVLALLLYCLHTFSPMRAVTAVYNGSRLKLMTDLPRRIRRPPSSSSVHTPTVDIDIESQIQSEEDVLLWASFILADSWRAANDTLLPQGLKIMSDLRARFPETTSTWEDCETVLKRFFWTDKFIGRCARFWSGSEVERIRKGDGKRERVNRLQD
ncbi:hypothetical protein H2200_000181 [Cladophialophora chaetospira]|uniref:Uncharacterized protein n=1 Tax=Cladophialophora chaetospira TaxID=386627 RepID=A0AA39CQP6_9EURO|nr:hypothetical protein H2200_000181 [Cladophialophora chaetospira]